MNIVFAVQNNDDWSSKISSRFGRGNGFILYNEESKELSYHSNEENVNAGHGAGIQASQTVVNLKAEIVITGGSMGPKAFEVLKSANIKMFTKAGETSVKEAYDNFKNNIYSEILTSDQ